MEFLKFVLKVLIILGTVALAASPLLIDYLTFRKDKENKISYKRFRIVIYAVIYAIAITLVLYLFKEIRIWFSGLSFIRWLAARISISSRVQYFISVFVVLFVNFVIGILFVLLGKLVRIKLKDKDLLTPKKDGEFNWRQKAERKVIRFFHKEVWFFVAGILKWFNLFLSLAYAAIFTLFLIPAVFSADWIPYQFILTVFSAGYLYPVITLLVLWQAYYFLKGISLLEKECPELLQDEAAVIANDEPDMEAIDRECQSSFRKYFGGTVNEANEAVETPITDHERFSFLVGEAISNDSRTPQTPKEVYLSCADVLFAEKESLLLNGSFFSEFSLYLFRYLSLVAARGDNVIIVCNSEEQIKSVYEYVKDGLSKLVSLYCKEFQNDAVDFDNPVWRILKICDDKVTAESAAIDDNSILITTLNFLCSSDFEKGHESFFHLLDTIIFVDSQNAATMFPHQLAALNTRLMHITESNARAAKNGVENPDFNVRYMSRQVRYICFDDTRTSGLDKVLKNMLSVDVRTVDCMNYNDNALIRCYTLDVTDVNDDMPGSVQFIPTDEQIGPTMNMAILSLAKGAKRVSIFGEGVIPYAGIMETLTAHTGQIALTLDEDNIQINKYHFDSNEYSVVIAVDAQNNLPAAIRKYASMVSDGNTLIMVVSRPYMLRDFYLDNLEAFWKSSQILRIPVEEGSKRDIAQKILVKANSGGISEKEIYRLAFASEAFRDSVESKRLYDLLRGVVEQFGIFDLTDSALLDYFEFVTRQDFTADGKYICENKVLLRSGNELYDIINGRDTVSLVCGEKRYMLNLPKWRLPHNYIEGQNLLFGGNVYNIYKIDAQSGILYTNLATGGKNDVSYEYIQDREYRLDYSKTPLETVSPSKHIRFGGKAVSNGVLEAHICNYRVPAEVITRGYYAVDPHTFERNSADMLYYDIGEEGNEDIAKRVYRRYGNFTNPTYDTSGNGNSDDLFIKNKGLSLLSVKIVCEGIEDINRVSTLSAVVLNELLHSMFPSVADAIAVCPVYNGEYTAEPEYQGILDKLPKASFIRGDASEVGEQAEGTAEKQALEFVIIEDSVCDLGVISGLLASGDNILNTIFAPIASYLEWYIEKRKNGFGGKKQYLHFGLNEEPKCFDFDSLNKLAQAFVNPNSKMDYVDLDPLIEYETCMFCGKRIPKSEQATKFDDGRVMCAECAASLVGNDKKLLQKYLIQVKMFLEDVYGITLDKEYEVCFESTLKITNALKKNKNIKRRGSDSAFASYVDTAKKKLHVEYDLPGTNLCELLVRELTHLWQLNNLPELEADLAEGHVALVAVQYLRYTNKLELSKLRAAHYESNKNNSGIGYRKLSRALLENPQYRNNPFKYLLESSGKVFDDNRKKTPRIIESGEYGLPYTPSVPDRCAPEKVKYFYYERLNSALQKVYESICEAIAAHSERVSIDPCGPTELYTVVESIKYDRPEFFYFDNYSFSGSEVLLDYHVSAEEAELMKRQIDERAASYLEGIEDTMSAYDVALRLHVKMINSVDYDSLALDVEDANMRKGIQEQGIDRIRTICGIFLDGRAVCAGYAKAMQYLLQKCGVEAGYIVGAIRQDNGELSTTDYHAWNIVKMDGDYYLIDTTWDDGSNTDVQKISSLDYGFAYFAVTTEEMLRSRDSNVCPTDIPPCTATKCNYFYHNDRVFSEYDLNKIIAIAENSAKNGSMHFEFKCNSQALRDEIYDKLFGNDGDWKKVSKAASKHNKRISSSGCGYSMNRNIWTIRFRFAEE